MKAVVLASSLATFASCFANGAYLPMAPFLASKSQVAVLLSAFGFTSCVILVPAGLAVDRFGSKYVMKRGMWLFLLGLFLVSASSCFASQLLGRLISGAAGSIVFNAGMAMIIEDFQEPERSEYIGMFLGIGNIGNLVGPPLAGYTYILAKAADFPQPQAPPFIFAFVLVLLGCVVLERTDDKITSCSVPLLEPATADGGGRGSLCHRIFGVYSAVGVKSWVLAATLTGVWGAASALLCGGAVDMHLHGFSAIEIGAITVPASIMQAVVSPWSGRMAGKPHVRAALITLSPLILSAVLACSALMCFYKPDAVLLPVALALAGSSAAMAAVDAPSISLMADLAVLHGRGYGEAVTASELAVTAGQALGPSFGLLMLRQGLGPLCLALAACTLLVSAASFACLQHKQQDSSARGSLCRA
ncbi:unnamed protein product [Polarella glacialis]|uniref:Major facilitator superfamily (MFS) profile domain-containing protein n=1 Tax=Polarella glacialis TaxID=89957 RepID=A0A813FUW5_POLGL|nr:unnamed protein product [Polarella glacialis]CAE8644830.1 unnamed protein product [Polarella glacialis]